MTQARRILAFDQDEAFLEAAGRLMARAGLQFQAVRDPAQVMVQVTAFQPDAVLLDRSGKGTGFAEALEQLRDSNVPLVFVLAETGERALIRAVQAHAVEVMLKPFGEAHIPRLLALLGELAQRPRAEKLTWEERVARNFLDLARRHKLRGSLVVNRGTPFEGRVVFRDGALVRATYGPLSGKDAVREILQVEDGLYEMDASLDQPPERRAVSATQLEEDGPIDLAGGDELLRPRMLVVDDEQDITVLLAKSLERAGFKVSTASDGRQAMDASLQTPFDLILADLSMPRMDGWEMLRMLKADHRTSEIPVVVLSAHDDYRETLRAARAGAYDYLGKTGRSEVIVSAALRAITPRLETLFHLVEKQPVEVRTQAIGLQWILRALARMKATGTLFLRDDWGGYRVEVKEGRPTAAVFEAQQRRVTGLAAFVRMMVATAAQGRFDFAPVQDVGAGGLPKTMEDLIQRTCETLNGAEARANEQLASTSTSFDVDPELYELFCRIAPPRKVAFARGVIDRKLPLGELTKALVMPPEQGTDWFNELARRGVIKRRAKGTSKPRFRLEPQRALTEERPLTPDRRAALAAQIRAELGEAPWVVIAESLDISLVSKLDREMSFVDLVQFAKVRGYDWRDVYTVLGKMTAKKLLKRVHLGAEIAPPNLIPGPDVDEKQLQAWTEWSRKAQPIWKSALG